MRLRGGLLVGMRGFGVFLIGEVVCELLVLLEAYNTLRLNVNCCVSDDVSPPDASLSGVGL